MRLIEKLKKVPNWTKPIIGFVAFPILIPVAAIAGLCILFYLLYDAVIDLLDYVKEEGFQSLRRT